MALVLRHFCRHFVKLNPKCIPALRSVIAPCTVVRTCTSKSFNLNDIAISNLENKSIDGTKKTVKSKKSRKSKSETVTSKEAAKVNKDSVTVSSDSGLPETASSESGLPEWFGTVLDSPLYPEAVIDPARHQLFKEFVEELDIRSLPSVSTVIKKTEPKSQQEILRKWQQRKTIELGGEKQFQEYKQKTFDKGSNLHQCIQLQLSGETDFVVREQNEGHWRSLEKILEDVRDVRLMEEECVHPEMFYRGKFDCIAQYRGTLCLIEWKTSSKQKPLLSNTFDNPLQVAAYLGAVNRSSMIDRCGVPRLTQGAIVIAYPGGEPATVHMMNQKVCERYWRQWLNRLCQYWTTFYPVIGDQ